MKFRTVFLLALVALISGWAGWSARSFLAVDACLDAGGRWETNGQYCQGATGPLASPGDAEIIEKARRDAQALFRDGGANNRMTFPVVMKLPDRTCVELRPRAAKQAAPYVACYDNRTGENLEERVEVGF